MDNVRDVSAEKLLAEVEGLKRDGYRLVTLSCVETGEDTAEVIYHFDKNLKMTHLRLSTPKTEKVPSISPVLLAAFLVENEIQDQFGLCFDGLAIDYGQTLYLEDEVRTTPFCKYGVVTKAE